MNRLTDNDLLQLRQAARGCVSGDLSEWPLLNRAFEKLGIYLSPHTEHIALRDLATKALLIDVWESAANRSTPNNGIQ